MSELPKTTGKYKLEIRPPDGAYMKSQGDMPDDDLFALWMFISHHSYNESGFHAAVKVFVEACRAERERT